ncbi:hypothetical protein HOLleu_05603 [Holothuria leucospilota]|uniref:Uncharacterized protein n=1 Tax=Holothuria leucospilota TaxID=206669 RepID=A0A9Q1CLP2_HOLLE|nr:hypothetical protein HOLleu_05603 [Holothuria leucospilota]
MPPFILFDRNRLKVKNEKKKQMVCYKMFKISVDMSLNPCHFEMFSSSKVHVDKSSKSKEQRNKVNMEQCVYKNAAQLHRRHNVELPMSPNATPSILQLGDEVKRYVTSLGI